MRRWYANVKEVGTGGTTVVLAHGYGVDQSLWDKILPGLSSQQGHKVILFDWDFTAAEQLLQGGGRCTFGAFADDLIALMDDKGVRGAVLVGHSMSAMAACIASARRPDLFAHLILLCASPRYINSESSSDDVCYIGGFERAAIDGMLDAMSSDFDGWVKGFVPNAAGDPAAAVELEKSFLAMHPGVALELAKMIFLGDQRDALDTVTVPCTIVQVKADFAAPPSVAEYMKRRMTTSTAADTVVRVIDSVGHFPQLVAPQQLLDILTDVLTATTTRRGGEQVIGAVEVEAAGGGGTDDI